MSQIAAIARHGPLFRNLLRREVRQRYKGSALGLLWTLITPAIMVAAYTLVFHYVFRVGTIPHYSLFLFTGLTIWTFFLGGATAAASSLVANANLVKKVRFPREIVPLSSMAGQAFTAGTMFVILLPLCILLTSGSLLPLVALPGLVVLPGRAHGRLRAHRWPRSTSTSATSSTSWRRWPCPGSSSRRSSTRWTPTRCPC